jgi:hypothetical protein
VLARLGRGSLTTATMTTADTDVATDAATITATTTVTVNSAGTPPACCSGWP